jgi:MFS family permease
MYFIGILAASTIIPVGFLSDLFGRKWIFVITLIIVLVSVAGFIFARSIEELYIFMFLLGTTFPGRVIVGVNYAQEFQKKSWIEFI